MKFIKCPGCGEKISNKAVICHLCDFNIEDYFKKFDEVVDILDPEKHNSSGDINVDRRKDVRIRQNFKVQLNDELALLHDISSNGIKLFTPKVPLVPKVNVSLHVDNKILNIKGEVVWFSKKVSFVNLREIGIFIVGAPDSYYSLVEKCYKNQKDSSGPQKKLDHKDPALKKIFK